jgi:hypothetical protein
VPLKRQVRRVNLQQQAVLYRRLILDPKRFDQGIEVVFVALVEIVFDGGCDDAGRRRRHESVGEVGVRRLQCRLETFDLGAVGLGRHVFDRSDRHRRLEIADGGAASHGLAAGFGELGIILQLAGPRARPAPAEPRHPPPQIKEKCFAYLLAIARAIDAGVTLALDHPPGRRLALAGEPRFVNLLALGAPGVWFDQRMGAGQAAGVGGKDRHLSSSFGAEHLIMAFNRAHPHTGGSSAKKLILPMAL